MRAAVRFQRIAMNELGRLRLGLWFILLLVSMPLNELGAQTVKPLGMLRLRVIDMSTGNITPARLEVLNGAGESFIADDALPISVAKDDARSADKSLSTALGRFEKQTRSPFTGTNQFYTAGTASLRVPAGQYRVRAFKGPEYYIATKLVEVGAETDRVEEIRLSRFLDMPAKGWYSSDGHLHLPRTNRGVDPFIIKQMQAEDIHVGNILSYGNSSSPSAAFQYSYGPDSVYQEGNYLIRSGQENLRTHIFGHAITLGARESLWNREDYLIYRKFWEKASREGGLNGYAHGGDHVNYNYVPSSGPQLIAPYGLMHFIEVLQFNRARYDIWYDLLNLGFRIAPTAGTDYGGGSGLPGDERFYARVAGPLTFDSWLEAVRKGRTFVTTGPILEFRINGKDIGEEVILQKTGKVTIEGAVHFDPGKDVSDDEYRRSSNCDQLFSDRENGYVSGLEIVQNGDVVRQFPRLDNSGVIRFKIDYDIASSSWLALRTIQLTSEETRSSPPKKAAIAHTAPIYVVLNHSPPIAAQPKARVVARAWLARLDLLEERFSDQHINDLAKLGDATDGVSVSLLSESREAVRSEIKAARTFYEKYLLISP
jgi:hypothetical protein